MKNRTLSNLYSHSLLLVTTTSLTAQTPKPDPSLTPPGAPANKVFKTLDQIEPRIPINNDTTPGDSDSLFRIVNPGSYYLTANLQGVASKNGIEIDADDVTLDLNGFTLTGTLNSKAGILAPGGRHRIHIKNGHITSWGTAGITNEHSANGIFHIANITVSNNILDEILMAEGIVEGCTAKNNGLTQPNRHGIVVAESGVIRDCVARGNGGDGIYARGSVIERCTSNYNGSHGFIVVDSVIERCSSRLNGGSGFAVYSSSVSRCGSQENNANGFEAFSGSTIFNCNAYGNGLGHNRRFQDDKE